MSEEARKRMEAAQRIIARSGLTRAQLARDAGLNEATVWAWVKSKRAPGVDSLLRLAAGLEKRSAELAGLAAELRELAGGED